MNFNGPYSLRFRGGVLSLGAELRGLVPRAHFFHRFVNALRGLFFPLKRRARLKKVERESGNESPRLTDDGIAQLRLVLGI
jgi:hypothetical protein